MKASQIILVLALIFPSCLPAQRDTAAYEYKSGDLNGIDKWYMGRQIAHVMGFHGVDWLDRPQREDEERTNKLLKNLELKTSEIVADIGAGSGYHTLKMAKLIPEGKVYAVDIQTEMLELIEERAAYDTLNNVLTILGTEQDVKLPESSIDKVFMADVYHELAYPKEMMESIARALKSGGSLYLIEFRLEDDWVPIKPIHKMTSQQAILEMEAAGFIFEKNIGNLPWQHCLVFRKP